LKEAKTVLKLEREEERGESPLRPLNPGVEARNSTTIHLERDNTP
jgi:hypothetical protein